MPRGGRRPNAGRKKGSTAKRSREIVERELDKGDSAIEYLISVMRDSNQDTKIRLDAAKNVAPYMHPRLAAVEVTGKDGGALEVKDAAEPIDVARRLAFLLAQGAQAIKARKSES